MPRKKLLRTKLKFYKTLSRKKLATQKKCLQGESGSQFACDIVRMSNYIKHNKLSPHNLKKIKRFKKTIEYIQSNKTKSKKKRVLKALRGGFLGALIPIISGLAAPLISQILNPGK